jgi:hypothetical protein
MVYKYKILFGIIAATMLVLSPFLQDAEAAKSAIKDMRKDIERTVEKMDKQTECDEKNLEKTLYYSKKGKIYQPNPNCDPEKQYRYDRLNQLNGIDEYKDAHNFVLSNENYFQVENQDDENDDNDRKDKKDRDKDDDNDKDRKKDKKDKDRGDENDEKNDLGKHQKNGLE